MEDLPIAMLKKLSSLGLISHSEAAAGLDLDDHLSSWQEHQNAKESTSKHVTLCMKHVRRIWKDCRFTSLADVNARKVEAWLYQQKKNNLSPTTRNHYLQNFRSFMNWAKRDGRISTNPLESITPANQNVDRRYIRRPLELEEVQMLLSYVTTAPDYHGLTGLERELLYELAISTGLRWSEICTACRIDLNVNHDYPSIWVRAKNAKNRKEQSVPLNLKYLYHDITNHTTPHSGWRGDDSAAIMAAYIDIHSLPLLRVDGVFYDYAGAMKVIKNLIKRGGE